MAAPLKKQSVNLAAPAVRVSRIRRDPPPKVKEISPQEIRDREARAVVIGITVFAMALFAILVGFGKTSTSDWSPGQYRIEIKGGD